MADMIYNRQQSLNLRIPAQASIIGCGGVGAWVAIDLAMTGVPRLNLFDDDNLEMHNINRIPFTPGDVGLQKTEIVSDFITGIRPEISIVRYGKLSEITGSLIGGVVIDCTDRIATQSLVQALCKQKKLPYYRVGYDGNHLTVIDGQHEDAPKAVEVWDDGSGQEGYTVVPSWVVPPQVGAALVTYMVCTDRAFEPIITQMEDLTLIDSLKRALSAAQKEVTDRGKKKARKR